MLPSIDNRYSQPEIQPSVRRCSANLCAASELPPAFQQLSADISKLPAIFQ